MLGKKFEYKLLQKEKCKAIFTTYINFENITKSFLNRLVDPLHLGFLKL